MLVAQHDIVYCECHGLLNYYLYLHKVKACNMIVKRHYYIILITLDIV